VDRPLILHVARDSLGNLDCTDFREVPCRRRILLLNNRRRWCILPRSVRSRGIVPVLAPTAFCSIAPILSLATVGFDPLPTRVEVLSWGLLGPREQTTHHNHPGTHPERLEYVPNIPNAAVSNDRYAEMPRKLRDLPYTSCLRSPYTHDFLGDIGAPRPHTDTERVAPGINKRCGLLARDDVASDDLKHGVSALDSLGHLDLEH
jgi:hypothetical protein